MIMSLLPTTFHRQSLRESTNSLLTCFKIYPYMPYKGKRVCWYLPIRVLERLLWPSMLLLNVWQTHNVSYTRVPSKSALKIFVPYRPDLIGFIQALSNQKYREMLAEFGDVGLMTGD